MEDIIKACELMTRLEFNPQDYEAQAELEAMKKSLKKVKKTVYKRKKS